MCGRFKLSRIDKAELARHFGIDAQSIPDYADEIDNAPGSWRSVITMEGGERKWTGMRWGYVATIGGLKKLVFNAQAEKVTTNRVWRGLLHNRCVIPASAFFEWQKINGKRGGPKYEITVPGHSVFGFAAIYDDRPNPKTGEMERAFWIITTGPNSKFAELHDRQPVILQERSEYDEWLTSKEPPLHLLRVFPEDKMLITKVAEPAAKAKKSRSDDMPNLFDQ